MVEIELVTKLECVSDYLCKLRSDILCWTGHEIDCVFIPGDLHGQLQRELEEKSTIALPSYKRKLVFMGMPIWESECPDIKVAIKE